MKHIKHINEGFNSEDYYKPISPEYATKLMGTYDSSEKKYENLVEITDKEIEKIKSIYTNIKKPSFIYGVTYKLTKTTGEFIIQLYRVSLMDKQPLESQFIYKLDDEWFILKTHPTQWFKCDQLEGLLECMEDHKMNFNGHGFNDLFE